jgi:hypothetical protein
MSEYEPLTTLIAPALGIGWQSGTDLTVDVQPIAASGNIVRNWNGIAKNLADPEFRLFAIRISSGEGEYRPPALANMWPGATFTIVPPNEYALLIPTGGTTAVFPRLVHSARALTLGFDDVEFTVSGKSVTLSSPATEPVRVYARWIHEVMVIEPWTESYQERIAESRWSLSTEEVGGII